MSPLSRNVTGCLVAIGWLAQAALALPATKPTDRVAVLERQREHYLQSVRALPLLKQHRMSGVLTLQPEGGQLVLCTPLNPWPDFEGRRLELEGIPAPASVTYAQFVANDPNARQFEFKFEDYPDGDLFGQLRLQWRPLPGAHGGELSIEKSEQTSHSFHRVFYFQSPLMARLLVFANDSSADHNLQSFNYTEKDFATLRRLHAAEVEEWMRPVLHRLQQDAIFAPDINAAWQVLASEWPANNDMTREILRLLPELNSDQSRVRNRAADRLAGLGFEGATAILRLDRAGLSLEQNVRLDEVVSRFSHLSGDAAKRLGDNIDFLLDCQYCTDPIARTLAKSRLERVTGHSADLDPDATGPAKFEAVEKLRVRFHPPPTTLAPDEH